MEKAKAQKYSFMYKPVTYFLYLFVVINIYYSKFIYIHQQFPISNYHFGMHSKSVNQIIKLYQLHIFNRTKSRWIYVGILFLCSFPTNPHFTSWIYTNMHWTVSTWFTCIIFSVLLQYPLHIFNRFLVDTLYLLISIIFYIGKIIHWTQKKKPRIFRCLG